MNSTFVVNKDNLYQTSFVNESLPNLEENEVLFKIETYFLSSNNITYAVYVKELKYWDFFPQMDNQGTIPVWAYLKVVKSNNTAVDEGEFYFGLSPMSRYVKLEIGHHHPFGFIEVSQHRSELNPIYNSYSRIVPEHFDSIQNLSYSLMNRITFPTSFLIKYYLEKNKLFGSEKIIITSASSKTALGVAFLLQKYKSSDDCKIVGVTSEKNLAFVSEYDFYDQVISYSDITNAINQEDAIILDFQGDAETLGKLHLILDERLKQVLQIGATNWKADKSFELVHECLSFNSQESYQNLIMELGMDKAMQSVFEEMDEFAKAIKSRI
ncbi:MAG: DUF2855 family protein [Flavobacteriales bacterium]|nr:DUF2855 family protein [Flavobacteriales bacterium]